jgi:16S rRNA C967 or C1407 C5-methylase (RsmB/RsmF family)
LAGRNSGKELGANWEREMIALNEQAPTVLRTNSLKTTTKELISDLSDEGVASSLLKTIRMPYNWKRKRMFSLLQL